ncbi:MAG: hypothetical protein RIQ54_305 [Candidatus Parcubacteria bacterium]
MRFDDVTLVDETDARLDTPETDIAENDGVEVTATVIDPDPLLTTIFEPALIVASVNPEPLPIANCPFDGVAVNPVPPNPIPIALPFQIPVPIVPSVVIFELPAHVDNAVFSTLPNPKFVRAVEVLVRSERLFVASSAPERLVRYPASLVNCETEVVANAVVMPVVPDPVTTPDMVMV